MNLILKKNLTFSQPKLASKSGDEMLTEQEISKLRETREIHLNNWVFRLENLLSQPELNDDNVAFKCTAAALFQVSTYV